MQGMLRSLDMSKVYWKDCPIDPKGQFQGQEKYDTICLESVGATNLWFWHAVFGLSGTLNDLSIWERLVLSESLTNGDQKN